MSLDLRTAHEPPAASAGESTVPTRRLPAVASTVLLVMAMLIVTRHFANPLDNLDTWFHLSIGHRLWGSWTLTDPGQLSQSATSPWVLTQWSTEMAAARLEDWFGLPGVAWMFGAVTLGMLASVYLVSRRESDPNAAAVVTVLAVVAAAPALSARPQVVSLLMLSVCVGAWLRSARTLRAPWFLVPLTWLWATAHGLWTAGVVLGVVCCVGILLDARPDRRVALRLAAVPVLCVVAACLTPVGPALLTSQVAVAARASIIKEWAPTSFRTGPALVVAVMIGLVVLHWARSRQVAWLPILLLGLGTGWAIMVTRFVPCAAVVVAPLLARTMHDVLAAGRRVDRAGRGELAAVGAAVAGCLVLLAVLASRGADRPSGVPLRFEPRLAALPAGSTVATEDLVGDWVEWRYPSLSPSIDGMLDAYPVDYIHRFDRYRKVEPGWVGFVRDSGARVGVTLDDSALTGALQDQLGWRVVDRDGDYVYMLAP